MTETKRFPLRVLLSVTTGRLLTKSKGPRDNGISDLYEILGWMTNDSPMTHQLGRFMRECEPWLLRWFPDLKRANDALNLLDDDIARLGAEQGVELWLGQLRMIGIQQEYDVPRIPADDHDRKNPVAELVEMQVADKGIIVVSPEVKP